VECLCLKRRFSKDLESTQVDVNNLMSVFLHSLTVVVLMTCRIRTPSNNPPSTWVGAAAGAAAEVAVADVRCSLI